MNFQRLKAIYDLKWMSALPIKTGHYLELHEIVPQWDGTRISRFKWLVIKVQNPQSPTGTFTIRWTTAVWRVTLERVFPLGYHNFDKVIVLDSYKIRKSKLYYIRDKVGKDARMKSILKSSEREKVIYDAKALKAIQEEKNQKTWSEVL